MTEPRRRIELLTVGRHRSTAFDHFFRADQRYWQVRGARLAAATAYYGSFAVFALGWFADIVLLDVNEPQRPTPPCARSGVRGLG